MTFKAIFQINFSWKLYIRSYAKSWHQNYIWYFISRSEPL